MMHYLTLAQVYIIHQELMGLSALVRDVASLEAAVARPMSSIFGQDTFPTLLEKAAALLEGLARHEPFIDGNKRTAILATIQFLAMNGRRVTWDDHDAADFVVEVAAGGYATLEIAAWLGAHSLKMG